MINSGTAAAPSPLLPGVDLMRDHSTTIEHWLGLAHPDLTEHVRRTVRGGSTATAPWSEVAAHPVLAARVRGILSALQSHMADHRDHAMWTLWINTARRALNTCGVPILRMMVLTCSDLGIRY